MYKYFMMIEKLKHTRFISTGIRFSKLRDQKKITSELHWGLVNLIISLLFNAQDTRTHVSMYWFVQHGQCVDTCIISQETVNES